MSAAYYHALRPRTDIDEKRLVLARATGLAAVSVVVLKEISRYYSDAREHDGAWHAGTLARETFERLGLYFEGEPPR